MAHNRRAFVGLISYCRRGNQTGVARDSNLSRWRVGLEEGKQLVDGLRYFAEINDGKYPATLSIRGVVGEIDSICSAKSDDPSFRIDDARVSTLKYGAQYFETLQADGKDPVYHGASVTAAADKVLVRWKLDGESKYRVIFGDLRIKDVTAAQLQELEAK